ncbi:cupredoxin domain-containing protein [Burkholderia guangdongensis]|uniref:cupredoxin domain-containing protein n=1 Tax=Burkholderia guangdongensis TaxID=1792500 RepID=UPI0015CDECCC|nr:cupredoxin domain-containing protein [Burkholderia guangdongensis]
MRVAYRVTHHLAIIANAAVLGMAAQPAHAQQTVDATLLASSIELGTHSVKPGRVTFDVRNSADSPMTHEFVVLKTDLADGALPVRDGQVLERGLRKIGEIEDIAPGQSRHLTLTLAPGRYALICNMPGHYALGMHTTLVVAR